MTIEAMKQALEAGWPDSLVAPIIMAKLAEFAALVAAAERQRNLEMVQILVEAEREACAKVCDDWPNGRDDVCLLADAIRARGEK